MKEIKIELSDSQYDQLEKFVQWRNLNNTVKNNDKPNDYTVEDLLKGIILSNDIFHFKLIDPLSHYDVNGDTVIKNRFKEIADKNNITIKQVSEQLDMKPPNISKIWNNHSQPRMELFIKLWILLGYPKIQDCFYIEGD